MERFPMFIQKPCFSADPSKLLFAHSLLFPTVISLIKLSTLLMYKRIFIPKSFYIACHVIMGLTGAWFLASVLVSV